MKKKNKQKNNKFLLDFSFKSFFLGINIIILVFAPLIIAIMYGLKYGWGFWSFVIGFATLVTFLFWVAIAGTFEKYEKKLSSLDFTIANFIFPLIFGVIVHSNVRMITWEVASFDFMALALAVLGVMFTGLVVSNDKLFSLFGILFFGVIMLVPVCASEYFWLSESGFISGIGHGAGDYFGLGLRYIAIIWDAFILYKILYKGSAFG